MATAPINTDTRNPRSRYQYLTDTNSGTLAGELLRRYWQPVALVTDLPEGAAPLPLRIMGDDLVLFRDGSGKVGALDRKCAHRCADLALARVESDGLRCPYHGWLFDGAGSVLDQPAEASPTAKHRIKARAYPVHEAAGAFWLYLGPGEAPPFPDFPALRGDQAYRYTCRWFGESNWLQASEGNIDPVHTSYLHQIELGSADMQARWGIFSNTARPQISVEDTRFGIRIYTTRALSEGGNSLRVTNFVMPNACAVGGFEGDLGEGGATMLWDVPVDNEHHWRWEFIFHRSGELAKEALDTQYRAEKLPGTDRMTRTAETLYGQDRASMEAGYYLGLGPCFSVHDVVITQSQGQVHDQRDEHLSSSDIAIVRARRMLDEGCQAVAAGEDPRGVFRDAAASDLTDVVVITANLAEGESKEAFVEKLAKDPALFALAPL
ncbi:Rieske 2Fe-2S domain-containing protein [Novosphingobium sp. 9]|uniref:Rieske 2Fe-2S domain-containing protein n=1 Tax=Novosphingobium sp. 9 TaxID=2025349 RepID=UPI0021B5778F|nr:Rieske 2Fe-2S domain-containing protein [Novosphingobium sp. 9]